MSRGIQRRHSEQGIDEGNGTRKVWFAGVSERGIASVTASSRVHPVINRDEPEETNVYRKTELHRDK
jgi:hypothetical protein